MKNFNTSQSHSGRKVDSLNHTKINDKKIWTTPMLLHLNGKETLTGNTTGLYEGQVIGSGYYASVIS